ncbi:signal peptidase complex subunit 1 [Nematocida minor]|uniref:signal peptidase complex subunit 1 n=1 Tax=Nematocida minor TaxID=1912983 RepID=UPI00221ED528|nr:signal peptidase complex subunit 1 [Nematocida minor]KAI5189096.1 signal peptidase complex subunit 1 [Nematocida minor]
MKWIENLAKKADPPADYIGQYLANRIMHTMLLFGAIVSLVSGYIYKDIFVVAYVYLAICLLMLATVVPAWPIYRRNPVSPVYKKAKHE